MLAQPPAATTLLLFTAAWLVATAFWLWTLFDCLAAGRVGGRAKHVWTGVLLGTYAFGAAAYFLAVWLRRPRS